MKSIMTKQKVETKLAAAAKKVWSVVLGRDLHLDGVAAGSYDSCSQEEALCTHRAPTPQPMSISS